MAFYYQSATYTRTFFLIQSSDHITGLTGATATVNISKAGGTFGAAGGVVTEIANGWYKVALTTTDTNTVGDLSFHITATSADPGDFADQVISGVTVATNNDKSGYSLTQAFPTNFSSLAITAGGAVTVGTNNDKTGYSLTVTPPTSTQIATSVWQDTTAGDFTTASSIGKSLYTSGNVPGAANGLFIAGSNAATTVNFTGNLSGSVGSVTGAVGSVTSGVTVTTNNDKTGYSLANGQAIPAVRTGTAQTGAASSITLDSGASSTNDLYTTQMIYLTGGTGAGQSRKITGYAGSTKVATVDSNWVTTPDATTTFDIFPTYILTGSGDSAATIWSYSTRALTDKSGFSITSNSDKTGYSLTQTFPTNFSSLAITAGGATTVGTNNDKTGYSLTQSFPTNFSLLSINGSGYVTYVNDPWAIAVPGSYGAGSAGYILGTNLNATVTSRSAPTTAQTIDLTTTVSTFTGKPGTIGQLLYFLRQYAQNKLDFNKSSNVLTLYEDDGTTAKMTYSMTDNANDAIRGAGA